MEKKQRKPINKFVQPKGDQGHRNEEQKKEDAKIQNKEDDEERARFIKFDFDIENPDEFIEKKISEINTQLEHMMFNLETHLTPHSIEMILSDGHEFKNGGIYIGTGGNLVYYYKKILYYEKIGNEAEVKEATEAFEIAFETNQEVWRHQSMDEKNIPSFFMGMPGIYTIGYIVYYKYVNNKTRAEQ